jgi:hypothetical protein
MEEVDGSTRFYEYKKCFLSFNPELNGGRFINRKMYLS